MSHEATMWAVKVRGISCTEARVLWHLADCHNPVYGCYPKQDYLAEACEIDERSIRRALAALKGKGLVNWIEQREGKNRKPNRYSLAFEAGFRRAEEVSEGENEPDKLSGSNEASTGQESTLQPDSDGRLNRTQESSIEPVREPVIEPVMREGAREGGEEAFHADDPAKFGKRVKAMEIGTAGNAWPGAVGSSTSWAAAQFEKLTSEERRLAEERRDTYLAECKAQKVKPVALGVYFRDRKFLDVAMSSAARPSVVARIPVAPFGPVWAGMRALALARGPEELDMPLDLQARIRQVFDALAKTSESRAMAYLAGRGIGRGDDGALIFPADFHEAEWRRRVRDSGFPEVNRLHNLASQRERDSAEARFEALAALCEPVPVGSDLFEEWRSHHEAAGWPFVPDPGSMKVVYFPKGGPDGLAAFEMAARAVVAKERGDEHAA